jgi:hypothetical protein
VLLLLLLLLVVMVVVVLLLVMPCQSLLLLPHTRLPVTPQRCCCNLSRQAPACAAACDTR